MKSRIAVLAGILLLAVLLGMGLLTVTRVGDPEGAQFSAVASEDDNNLTTVGALPGAKALDALLMLSGWLLFVILLYFWVDWTERDRGLFSGAGWRHLE